MTDYDEDDIDVCVSCGSYFGWASVRDVVDANPHLRPFPQQCRKCCGWLLPDTASPAEQVGMERTAEPGA